MIPSPATLSPENEGGEMVQLPMFPLGSVLLPWMPLALRVFEPRYLRMVGELLDRDEPEFGVVLIERGFEVGGGDQRFSLGTTARILQIEAPEGYLALVAQGQRRFVVDHWGDEEPYPMAEVTFLPEWNVPDEIESSLPLREATVRDIVSVLEQRGQSLWPADTALSDEPTAMLWQLAGLLPVSALDHQRFLESESAEQLAEAIDEAVEALRELTEWDGDLSGDLESDSD